MLLTSQREIGNKNKVRIYLENPCPAKQLPWCCTLKEIGGKNVLHIKNFLQYFNSNKASHGGRKVFFGWLYCLIL